MIWIQATKTRLYRLIAEHIYLPKLKETNFIEAHDRSGYCLEWHTPNGTFYRACYLFAKNSPRLVIQFKEKKSKVFDNLLMYELDVDNLVARGMIRGVRSMRQIRKLQLLQYQGANDFMHDSYAALSQAHQNAATAM